MQWYLSFGLLFGTDDLLFLIFGGGSSNAVEIGGGETFMIIFL